MGAAPRQRGSLEAMQVEAAEARRFEHRGRQQEAVGDDDGGIGGMRGEGGLVCLAPLKLAGVSTGMPRRLGERCTGDLRSAMPRPAGTRRLRVDGDDLVPGADDLRQRRHGEVRRAHEDDAQGHWLWPTH